MDTRHLSRPSRPRFYPHQLLDIPSVCRLSWSDTVWQTQSGRRIQTSHSPLPPSHRAACGPPNPELQMEWVMMINGILNGPGEIIHGTNATHRLCYVVGLCRATRQVPHVDRGSHVDFVSAPSPVPVLSFLHLLQTGARFSSRNSFL